MKMLVDLVLMTPEMARVEDSVDPAETQELRPQKTDFKCMPYYKYLL